MLAFRAKLSLARHTIADLTNLRVNDASFGGRIGENREFNRKAAPRAITRNDFNAPTNHRPRARLHVLLHATLVLRGHLGRNDRIHE